VAVPFPVFVRTALELFLASVVSLLGVLILIWAVAAVVFAEQLLSTSTAASGLLAGAIATAGLCLILSGGQVRSYRAVLELGLAVLGIAAMALLILGAVNGRAGAVASGAVLLAARLAAGWLRRLALRSAYRPRWFSASSFDTMVAVADTMLDADGREAIPPERVAMRTDQLLASIDAPIRGVMRLLFIGVEWFLPAVVIGRPLRFSVLGSRSRRQLIEHLIRPTGLYRSLVTSPFRSAARALKVLTCAGYYGDPKTMRAIGFEEFEGSKRSRNFNLGRLRYPGPGAEPAFETDSPTPRKAASASISVDAVVIGSGASGSVMAYQLARAGLSVAVVERGRREDPATFEHDEAAMFARLYKHGGLQTAADNNSAIFQGSTVGGSTVVNNAIWLRPKLDRVLGEWRERGAEVDQPTLESAYSELEQALHVSEVDHRVANPGTDLLLNTPPVAGASWKLLKNNRHGCTGCGWCNYGCRYNRKTSMLVTYIPWAEARGVRVYDSIQQARIVVKDGRAVGVEGRLNNRRIVFDASKVVLCAGAIGSSVVLLESGITAGGNVGKRFHALGGTFLTGDMGQTTVDGFAGIGLTCMAESGHDYVMESYFAPPLAFSVRVGGWLLSHFERVERYCHFIDGGVMVGTSPECGEISLKRGKVNIDLKLSADDLRLLRQGLKHMAGLYFTAGARRAYPSTFRYIDLVPETFEQVIDDQIKTMDDILFGTAHPQGGNVMNRDPRHGVVDEQFKVHGVEGLYVADTSVWPSNIRANCQATAMAMAHYAAQRIAPPSSATPPPSSATPPPSSATPPPSSARPPLAPSIGDAQARERKAHL
jgi:choline dehydrogenase-like flavoprotein